ncbi:hypothetical protein CR513_31292, partial [Mucuna pruriens]
MKHPTKDHSIFRIDTIDVLVEEYMSIGTGSVDLSNFIEIPNHFQVIIANNLNREQEEMLLNALRKHKKAIGWTLADLPRINPSICMHKILLEEEARPIRQQ